MSDANTRLKTIICETKRESANEDASFREVLDYFPDERSNSVTDISTTIHRSLSEDFQDSFDFFSFIEEMSHPGGTNSLPAFLTGRSGGHAHSALLQQSQSNRAVENDYCENPPSQRIPPSRTRGQSRHARTTTGTHDHHHRRHRHHHHPRDPNGRHPTRSSNRRHCNREEGTQHTFHGTVSTSATGTSSQRGDGEFDTPPPRPPLSKYHIEHRYASRALRPSSSLPASLPVTTGNEILVPMRNNPVPSYQPRHGRGDRQRTGGSSPRSSSETLRGYSLTPPPVCRANKPKYDSNNRIIQTVSSPSVVTQCVDSSWRSQNQWSFLPSPGNASSTSKRCSSSEKQTESSFTQPTHVVISQQPKRRSKKKLLDDDDDEIARQKRGLVVNMNNNFAKSTQPISGEKLKKKKKKSKSAKSCEIKDSKKHEFEKLAPADSSANNGAGDQLSSTEITPLRSGERCPRCGKCSEDDPDEKKPKKNSENPPDNRCDSAVDTCVETATCFCCVKGVFYHCLSHEDEDTFAEKPCSCQSEKCCLRWSIMGILSLCLPCLCCYPLARGSVKLCRGGCGCLKSNRQGNEPYS